MLRLSAVEHSISLELSKTSSFDSFVVELGVSLELSRTLSFDSMLTNSGSTFLLWPTGLCSCRKLEYWTRAAPSSGKLSARPQEHFYGSPLLLNLEPLWVLDTLQQPTGRGC